jgi:hypothetical protein
MRNLIGLTALVSMMLIPGSPTTAQAGASVSLSVGFGSGYGTCYDDDVDWDNALVLDDSRIGVWVMLPSGRWVLRIRSMWWNAEYDEWAFGPWYYDYNIAYNHHSRDHFFRNCGFNAVGFHFYMSQNYRPWHERHYYSNNGRYTRRYSSYEAYHQERYKGPAVRHQEPVVVREVRPSRGSERTTVIVRENKQPVRIDGGNRPARIENERQARMDVGTRADRIDRGNRPEKIDRSSAPGRQVEVTRSRATTRETGNRGGTVTRTETRRDVRKR